MLNIKLIVAHDCNIAMLLSVRHKDLLRHNIFEYVFNLVSVQPRQD